MRLTGIMARRLLVNWRVPVSMAERVLPPAVRPKVIAGHAVAGLCWVRLEQLRPVGLPAFAGLASENLAVRIAIEWAGGSGAIIFRRDTASRFIASISRHANFGEQHFGTFQAHDEGRETQISASGFEDGQAHHTSVIDSPDAVNASSVFSDVSSADAFFCNCSRGYSAGRKPGTWVGLCLQLHEWNFKPVRLVSARSTLIDSLFEGTAVLDSAFIMRNLRHTWTPMPVMSWGAAVGRQSRVTAAA
jgi:hypothetical protein